jgi:hypothetical protein
MALVPLLGAENQGIDNNLRALGCDGTKARWQVSGVPALNDRRVLSSR